MSWADFLKENINMPPPDILRRNVRTSQPGPWSTSLDPSQEAIFHRWVRLNQIPFNLDDPVPDYDMRGYFLQRNNPGMEPQINSFDRRMHFPDTFKTPLHRSFSNQSRYALPSAPRWAGPKLLDQRTGEIILDESNY